MMKKAQWWRIGVIAAVVAALIGVATPANASPQQSWRPFGISQVSVFHGVPATPVDVYVNGLRVLNDFQPGTFAGPYLLPSGTYRLAITAADARNDRNPVIGPLTVSFARNTSYTVAAHLTPAGAPTATVFTNDISRTPQGTGRLIVRHTAAAPAVDVLAGGAPVIKNLTNPHQVALVLPAGTVNAAVALAGTTAPVIGPAAVPVKAGTDTIVYAWGSAAAGNLTVAVQSLRQGTLFDVPWMSRH
ncbi:DUF4397 domain-containing protein [Leifsonia sp. fls2-241-R2A-40a]|uniref:DUF4397 domain-containing protein n=1 Tax=Leifsonia sp. fls2-241-R2A-40a TaxID=3040290 RepID=UPI00254C0BFF|nr:DUF4397 domain-containing protein [Leifsonia sp. fls2-241-R2A-40a]